MRRYELTTEAKCPVDGLAIPYDIKIEVDDGVIAVEWLLETIAGLTAEPTMQEPFTEALATALYEAGHDTAFIETVGTHSGVKITCLA